ncbi:penicillin-binding transpeptidase domain-containing protein [Dethiothermospora halolimnae]|uniref:penicillin-binding transpeptidase domain-containing protein n=1 Tax=Dethiothermospora halolimnae TaxID=3114390 RepID=UPI003CCC38D9
MSSPTISSKRRLILMLLFVTITSLILVFRIGYLQIVKGDSLKEGAINQWSKDIPIDPKRGKIYDRNRKVIVTNINAYKVECTPADIENPKKTSMELSRILKLNEKEVMEKITKKQRLVKIKQWINEDQEKALRKADLKGVFIVPNNKRLYLYGNFAPYIVGFTNIDNKGLYGIERTFDKYLTGMPGRIVHNTDSLGRQLPYNNERFIEPKQGLNLVLTIDEAIQHFAEKAALEAQVKNKAKKVTVIMMEPNTGDILAMATKPDYNPNSPRKPLNEELKTKWSGLSEQELVKEWNNIWRPYPISDTYEPGSTFKIITSAAGLEEKVVNKESEFYCGGYITDIPGAKLKCWRYYRPHGHETFVEGVQNSCNPVFVKVAQRLGNEKMIEYIKAFGFGEKTNINLLGEQTGIIPRNPDTMREVRLATVAYGQGISVTPIQLITAVSAVANGGKLMEPRLVKEMVDEKGNVIHKVKPKVRRQVISEETSKTLLEILQSVVSDGTGGKAYVEGYRIGGKTGTAQKVIDGRYASGKYIASFMAIAPADDPKVVALVIIDEPSTGVYYGGQIAAPVAGQVIKETLDYLEVEPKYNKEELENRNKKRVMVPDLRNLNIIDATKKLDKLGLKYNTDVLDVNKEDIVIDQFPMPNTKVKEKSVIDIFVRNRKEKNETVVIPNLTGKTREEAIKTLNKLNLRFKFTGNGRVIEQQPKAGKQVEFNSLIEIRFGKVEDKEKS